MAQLCPGGAVIFSSYIAVVMCYRELPCHDGDVISHVDVPADFKKTRRKKTSMV